MLPTVGPQIEEAAELGASRHTFESGTGGGGEGEVWCRLLANMPEAGGDDGLKAALEFRSLARSRLTRSPVVATIGCVPRVPSAAATTRINHVELRQGRVRTINGRVASASPPSLLPLAVHTGRRRHGPPVLADCCHGRRRRCRRATRPRRPPPGGGGIRGWRSWPRGRGRVEIGRRGRARRRCPRRRRTRRRRIRSCR